MAGSGLLIVMVEIVMHAVGLTPEPGTAAHVANAFLVVFGWGILIWGQLRRKDLIGGLLRRD